MDVDKGSDASDADSDQENSSEDDWSSEEDSGDKGDLKPPVNNGQIPEDEENEPDVFDVNAPDWDTAFTPLQYAVVFGSTSVVNVVISAGADVKIVTKANGYNTPYLHQLAVAILTENETTTSEIVKRLVAAGAVSSGADENLFTIFYSIICSGRTDLVSTLLRCDPNSKVVVNTPLCHSRSTTILPVASAVFKRTYSILALLLAYGARLVFTEEDYIRSRDARKEYYQGRNAPYQQHVYTPIETALVCRDDIVELFLSMVTGANLLTMQSKKQPWNKQLHLTLYDWVHYAVRELRGRLEKDEPRNYDSGSHALITMSSWKSDMYQILLKAKEV
ncbi:hypothetical protein AcW2_007169 [Taiwanofungus camphoratus]|nr:hypothetical protein AcW2_007169 [Antrodia cinnamomea]